jgi:transcriptional regulator with XRE-family HTH domain
MATCIGKQIKRLREEADWSQSELARRTGGKVTSAAISQIENSDREPTLSTLNSIAFALNVSILIFLDDYRANIKEQAGFFRRFKYLYHLKDEDQELILNLAHRLNDYK